MSNEKYPTVEPSKLEPEYSEYLKEAATWHSLAAFRDFFAVQLALRDREIANSTKNPKLNQLDDGELADYQCSGCGQSAFEPFQHTWTDCVDYLKKHHLVLWNDRKELKEECKKLNRHNGELLLEITASEKRESELKEKLLQLNNLFITLK